MTTIRVFDNKKTWDRFTIIIDGDYYGMSTNATEPNGFNQYGGKAKDLVKNKRGFFDEKILGKEIKDISKLPPQVKKAIEDRAHIS